MTTRTPLSTRSLLGALAAAGALLMIALLPGEAHASVVGPTGQIKACYAKKGKAKGTLRVVRSGKRCRKGQKPLVWNSQGQQGSTGAQGAQGIPGQVDSSVTTQLNSLTSQLSGLTTQLSQLQSDVTSLQGVLSGLSNSDLAGAVTNAAKLNGISAQDLTDAIGAVPDVTALCTQMSEAVTQLNSIGSVLTGLNLSGGLLGLGLGGLVFNNAIPSALSSFTCP